MDAIGRLQVSPAPLRPSKSPGREMVTAASPLFEDMPADLGKGNIKVVCRFRPLNEKEKAMNLGTCVEFLPDKKTVAVNSVNEQSSAATPLKFTYDAVFPPNSQQMTVYEYSARPIVESVLEGFNGTVFAYGQTGSGKTFTMTGPNVDDEDLKGVIPRMINTVFEKISNASDDLEFSVKVGYAEIYMEKIKDLLEPANSNLKIHEDKARGVYIADLTEEYVATEAEVYEIMKLGSANREVGATLMNEGSSRSHSMFLMTITQNNTKDYSAKTGKLYLIDLAGSEKVGKTGAEGKRLDEAKNINKSLSTLGQVINALTDGKSTHIPYRDSKLTRVLQDSLGGNSKTALIVTCSPSPYNEAETISTLRFGIRAKAIKNKPKVNREYTVAELKLLLAKAEAELLRKNATIELLTKKITEMGGNPITEADIAAFRDSSSRDDILKTDSPELEELGAEMDALRDKLEEERKTNMELRQELINLSDSEARAKAEIEGHRLEIATLNLKFSTFDEVINDKNLEIDRCKKQLSALEESISVLTSQKIALETEKSELQTAISTKPSIEEMISMNNRTSVPRLIEDIEIRDNQIKNLKARLEHQEFVLQQIGNSTTDTRILQILQKHRSEDSEQIVSAQEQLQSERSRNQQMFDQLQQLHGQIKLLLTSKVPNYEEIRKKIEQDAVAKEQAKWEIEREMILKDLHNRVDKVIRLEIELDEMQESYSILFASKSLGDPKLRSALSDIQHEKEQIQALYRSALTDKSDLVQINDTQRQKLERMEARLKDLGSQLEKAIHEQLEKKNRIEELEKMCEEITSRTSVRSLSIAQHIRKRIKGGKHQKSGELVRLGSQPFEIAEDDADTRKSEDRKE